MPFSAPVYVSLLLSLAVTLSALLRRSPIYKPWHSLLGLVFLGLSGWQQPLVFGAGGRQCAGGPLARPRAPGGGGHMNVGRWCFPACRCR